MFELEVYVMRIYLQGLTHYFRSDLIKWNKFKLRHAWMSRGYVKKILNIEITVTLQ